jgi:AraC-like DNA-binding protein
VKDASAPSFAVGAQLRPGGGFALLGIAADELAERHTALDELWGSAARALPERLAAAGSLEAALAIFEAALLARVPRVRAMHPAVAAALVRFERDPVVPIRDVVGACGLSHRAFLTSFVQAVGLAPKVFRRVGRFQRAVRLLGEGAAPADVAFDAGYADQPHLTREFAAIGGISPAALQRVGTRSNHVRVR